MVSVNYGVFSLVVSGIVSLISATAFSEPPNSKVIGGCVSITKEGDDYGMAKSVFKVFVAHEIPEQNFKVDYGADFKPDAKIGLREDFG